MDADRIQVLRSVALSHLGIPYIYGGKNRLIGLDCSGLLCEIMDSMGIFPTGTEINAQGVHDHFKDLSEDKVFAFGSLAFYGPSLTEIDHVAFFLDTHLVIEAGHGTAETKTIEDARARGAYVRVRPFDYRKDLIAVIRPFYEKMGL